MLLIECPWCGPRAETEFSYGGEAGILRPADPEALSDAEWADYLFYRSNSCGAHRELWNHAQGCRRWFGVERDTVSYRIERSYSLSSTETSLASGSDATVKAGADATADTSADATAEAAAEAGSGFSTGKGG